jgi:hypothetical protein
VGGLRRQPDLRRLHPSHRGGGEAWLRTSDAATGIPPSTWTGATAGTSAASSTARGAASVEPSNAAPPSPAAGSRQPKESLSERPHDKHFPKGQGEAQEA